MPSSPFNKEISKHLHPCQTFHGFSSRLGRGPKKEFFWEISPKSVFPPTHPSVFVTFGRTKGELKRMRFLIHSLEKDWWWMNVGARIHSHWIEYKMGGGNCQTWDIVNLQFVSAQEMLVHLKIIRFGRIQWLRVLGPSVAFLLLASDIYVLCLRTLFQYWS